MQSKKEQFDNFVKILLGFGADKSEFELWREIFDELSEDEQNRLLSQLKNEIQSLEAVSHQHTRE